jgi:hypothetical protein
MDPASLAIAKLAVDTLVFAVWGVVRRGAARLSSQQQVAAARHGLRVLTAGFLSARAVARAAGIFDELARGATNTLASVGSHIFATAVDAYARSHCVTDPDAPKFRRTPYAVEWADLPKFAVFALLPVAPLAAIGGGQNDHVRPAGFTARFLEVSAALMMDPALAPHNLRRDFLQVAAPAFHHLIGHEDVD